MSRLSVTVVALLSTVAAGGDNSTTTRNDSCSAIAVPFSRSNQTFVTVANDGARLGHRMSSIISGLSLARVFNLTYTHTKNDADVMFNFKSIFQGLSGKTTTVGLDGRNKSPRPEKWDVGTDGGRRVMSCHV